MPEEAPVMRAVPCTEELLMVFSLVKDDPYRARRALGGPAGGSPLCCYRNPPAICSVSPVIQRESSEARKTAAGATSRGCPIRPSGVCASYCLRNSLADNPAACTPSVSTMPGLIALTRMFRGPSSLASDLVAASTAAFVALYTEAFGGA